MSHERMISVKPATLEKALRDAGLVRFATDSHVEELRALLDAPYPSEAQLIAAGLGYPMSKEDAVKAYKASLVPRTDSPDNANCKWCHGCGHDQYGEPCVGCCAPAAQPQGDTVTFPRELSDELGELIAEKARVCGGGAFEIWEAICERFGTQAEQPAPVAVGLPDRSPDSYAIEHAEYMAKSADGVLEKFQAYGLALMAVDEGGDDGEGELLENIDSARGDLQESLVDLRSMVFEFRKRSAKSR